MTIIYFQVWKLNAIGEFENVTRSWLSNMDAVLYLFTIFFQIVNVEKTLLPATIITKMLYSPRYPHAYCPNMRYVYNIYALEGYRVMINMNRGIPEMLYTF